MLKQNSPLFLAPLLLVAAHLASPPLSGADALIPAGLREVRVGGEIGRRIEITVANNLLALDVDRDFLPAFREEPRTGKFIGLGMLLDSVVKLAAHTGNPRLDALRKHLVGEVIRIQEPDGYIGTFPAPKRVRTIWDVHELGYVILGLLEDHRQFGGEAPLASARRAADWLLRNWSALPPGWGEGADVCPHVAFTGIERTMLALHRATGERSYLEFVTRTRELPAWDLGIVVGRRPGIAGHVYAYLARCLAQLELHRMQPSGQLLRATERALGFMTHGDGMLVTGSCGLDEIWTASQDARGGVGETCALAYQLRVWDSLLRMNADPRMGDLMERTILNALFASQSPDGRRLRYFAPLEGDRAYWKTDTYCCPCNFRRIISELPSMVYYRATDGITVNLYTDSEARLDVAGGGPVSIRQETDYPNSGRIGLTVSPEKPAEFALRLRIPAWARQAGVTVNGRPFPGDVRPGTFLEVRREWRRGDRVDLDLPMEWRLVLGRQRQAGRVAVLRGPQVFCLNPEQDPKLAKNDGADLGALTIDPSSLAAPVPDASVRPGGIGCRLGAWKPGMGLSRKTDHQLTLTEFADPAGRATYFRLRDYGAAVGDELLAPDRQGR